MRTISRATGALLALWLMLCGFAVQAQTWYPITTDTFNRAASATVGNNWTDTGSNYSINGSNQLSASSSALYSSEQLYRPGTGAIPAYPVAGSNEQSVNWKVVRVVQNVLNSTVQWNTDLRYNVSTKACYLFGYNPGNFTVQIYYLTSISGLNQIAQWTASAIPAGHRIQLTMSAVGTGTVTLYFQAVDLDNSNAVIFDSTVHNGGVAYTTTSGPASPTSNSTVALMDNGPILTNSFVSYSDQAPPASALSLSPTTGNGSVGVASSAFTVSANGTITGTHNLTFSDGGAGGTFTPSSGAISNGSTTQTFTYTPATGGTATLTVTDSGGYTAATASYLALNTIPVNDPNWYFGEWAWYKSGSSWAATNACGNYFKIPFTGTTCYIDGSVKAARAAGISSGSYPTLRLSVDGLTPVDVQLPSAADNYTISVALNSANNSSYHYMKVEVVSLAPNAADRWNVTSGQSVPPNTVVINDIRIDGATRPLAGTPIALAPNRLLETGDSLTAGYNSLANSLEYGPGSYAASLARSLNAEYSVLGYSGAFLQGASLGSGNVPSIANTYGYYWAGQSRLTGGVFTAGSPTYLTMNLGSNDANNGQTVTSAQVSSVLSSLRTAAPSSNIAVIVPFGLRVLNTGSTTLSALQSGFSSFHTGSETRSYLVDLGLGGNAGLNGSSATLYSPDGIHILAERALTLGANVGGNFIGQLPATPYGRGRTLK